MARTAAGPVAAYLRVSSEDQRHDSQRAEIRRWLDAQGIDPDRVRWYADVESGRVASRPEFDRLQADVASGRVRAVVVFKLDRLGRDMLDGMELLSRWCKAGVRVASVTQAIDVSGTVGRIVAAVLLGMAEIEWTDRKERQAAGIALARAAGIYTGRRPGSTKARPARAAELRGKGLSAREIAAALDVSERTVYRYLDAAGGPGPG